MTMKQPLRTTGLDTIAACATAPVRSAIGVLRLSGPDALKITRAVFHKKTLIPRRMTFGGFYAGSTRIDEGLAVYLPAPNSYTGEDTVELYCHGSPGVLEALLDALYEAGARPAEPGEYTRRAYENGRLDLAQAEAVIDLIDSETRAAAKNAAAQLSGALGKKIFPIRDALVELAAHFSAVIDYPDDDVPEFFGSDALKTLETADEALEKLVRSFSDGQILRSGAACVLAGAPNVGKSSLLNALTGEDRAIVTDIPGTTRDVVEMQVVWEGFTVRLLDTAGLRESSDPIEREGVRRTAKAVENASLVLAVFDGTRETAELSDLTALPEGVPVIAVVNKSDLPRKLPPTAFPQELTVSAATGEGIAELREAMIKALRLRTIAADGSVVTNPRQLSALKRAQSAIRRAREALAMGITPDAVMCDIEETAEILGEITGQSASEDILSAIFSRFCVGK